MLANFKEYGFTVTAKRMPESCTACPFWGIDVKTFETGGCIITGAEIILDGRQDERRMSDCPIAGT